MFILLLEFVYLPINGFQQVSSPEMGESIRRVLIWTALFSIIGFGLLIWIRYKRGSEFSHIRGKGLSSFAAVSGWKDRVDDIEIMSLKQIKQGQILISIRWQGRDFLLGATPTAITVLSKHFTEGDT